MIGSDTPSALRHEHGRFTIWFLEYFLTRISTLPLERLDRLTATGAAKRLQELFASEADLRAAGGRLSDLLFTEIPKATDTAARSRLLDIRRRVFRGEPADPSKFKDLAPNTASALTTYASLRNQKDEISKNARKLFMVERERVRRELFDLCATPQINEGLLLDSEELFNASKRLAAKGVFSADSKAMRRFEHAASNFLTRWCCRPTPLSVITAVSLGRIRPSLQGLETRRVSSDEIRKRRVGISVYIGRLLAEAVSRTDDAWRRVCPRINPTLMLHDGTIEFWRTSSEQPGQEEKCQLGSTSEEIEVFLRLTRPRLLEAGAVAAAAARELNWTEDRAESFYRNLVKIGLLFGTLEIPIEETDPLGFVRRWLEAAPKPPTDLLTRLREVESTLARLESPSPDMNVGETCNRLRDLLTHDVPIVATSTPEHYLSIDSESSWDTSIGPDIPRSLSEAVAVLDRLQDCKKPPEAEYLRRLFGGGSGTPLLALWEAESKREAPPAEWASWRDGLRPRLNDWLATALKAGQKQVDLRLETLDSIFATDAPVAEEEHHAHLRFSVYPAPDGGPDILTLDQVFGNVATAYSRWLPLFSNGIPPDRLPVFDALRQTYDALARHHAGRQLVDLFYHAGFWGDQVAWHPSFWPLCVEANLTSRSRLPNDQVIPLGELYVRIENGTPGIEWRRPDGTRAPVGLCYNSLLVPKPHPWIPMVAALAGAFLPTRLQPFFDGLPLSEGVRWLPAFTCGRVMFQAQTWFVERSRFPQMGLRDEWDRFQAAARWRAELCLPRHVWVSNQRNDAPRLLDFENPLLVDALLTDLHKDEARWKILTVREEPFLFTAQSRTASPYTRQFSLGFYWRRTARRGLAGHKHGAS